MYGNNDKHIYAKFIDCLPSISEDYDFWIRYITYLLYCMGLNGKFIKKEKKITYSCVNFDMMIKSYAYLQTIYIL